MPDDYGDGPDQIPLYVPIERVDTLVRCQRCGSIIEGDIVGINQHNIWHNTLEYRLTKATKAAPLPTRYAGGEWRVGSHYDIHVYQGERPVATFVTPADAQQAVDAINDALRDTRETEKGDPQDG